MELSQKNQGLQSVQWLPISQKVRRTELTVSQIHHSKRESRDSVLNCQHSQATGLIASPVNFRPVNTSPTKMADLEFFRKGRKKKTTAVKQPRNEKKVKNKDL